MTVVDDHLANVANRFLMDQVVGRMIAAIPRGLVIHQHLDLALARGIGDGVRILGADRQRFFHHDVDAVAGAYLHHFSVVVSIGVRQHRLRMRLLQHVFEIGKEQTAVEIELRRVTRRDLLVRLGEFRQSGCQADAASAGKSLRRDREPCPRWRPEAGRLLRWFARWKQST